MLVHAAARGHPLGIRSPPTIETLHTGKLVPPYVDNYDRQW